MKPVPRQGDANRECVARGECRPRARASKNRKRWCAGKPGREHRWAWVTRRSLPNAGGWEGAIYERRGGASSVREQLVCLACGRQDDTRTRCLNCGEANGWVSITSPASYEVRGVIKWAWSHHRVCKSCDQVEGEAVGITRELFDQARKAKRAVTPTASAAQD